MMILRRKTRLPGRGASWALLGALVMAAGAGMASSERLVQSGFDTALSQRDGGGALAGKAMAQSEEYWLRNGRGTSLDVKPVAWRTPTQLNPGDRVTITPAGSTTPREFEVVGTRPVPGDQARSGQQAPLLAVTCRDVAAPDAQLLRIIIDDRALPILTSQIANKAL